MSNTVEEQSSAQARSPMSRKSKPCSARLKSSVVYLGSESFLISVFILELDEASEAEAEHSIETV